MLLRDQLDRLAFLSFLYHDLDLLPDVLVRLRSRFLSGVRNIDSVDVTAIFGYFQHSHGDGLMKPSRSAAAGVEHQHALLSGFDEC